MLKLFCIPGRLLAKLFSREKKRAYRSVRTKPGYGPGIVVISLVCWLALIGGVLFAVDKAGLLKQALDVGVEVAQGGGDPTAVDPEPVPTPDEPTPTTTGSAKGGLSEDGQSPSELPPVPGGTTAPAGGAPVVVDEQWLVILHSIPKSARDEAERRKTQYRNKGLEVDILDTDAFPRLKSNSGSYWIIALGPFENKGEAVDAANRANDIAKQFKTTPRPLRGL